MDATQGARRVPFAVSRSTFVGRYGTPHAAKHSAGAQLDASELHTAVMCSDEYSKIAVLTLYDCLLAVPMGLETDLTGGNGVPEVEHVRRLVNTTQTHQQEGGGIFSCLQKTSWWY